MLLLSEVSDWAEAVTGRDQFQGSFSCRGTFSSPNSRKGFEMAIVVCSMFRAMEWNVRMEEWELKLTYLNLPKVNIPTIVKLAYRGRFALSC